jgi:hypothetical protein
LFLFYCVDVNVAEIEARANEILGTIYSREDAEIQERLGDARDNRLFFFFGIHVGDHAVTSGRRVAQAKRAAKKGGQGSSDAAAPSACPKAIRKCCGRGTGHTITKCQKTSRAATSKVVSSSPEESNHSKSVTETNPPEVVKVHLGP